jgi:hypothetical protein
MFSFANMVHFLAYKFACLRACGLALFFILPSPFDDFFLRHFASSLRSCVHISAPIKPAD